MHYTQHQYKTLGFKRLIEAFCPASAFVSADSDEARNPQRFIHVTVGVQQRKPLKTGKSLKKAVNLP